MPLPDEGFAATGPGMDPFGPPPENMAPPMPEPGSAPHPFDMPPEESPMNLPPAAADDPSGASVDDIPMSGLSLPDQG
jgi:hypothetical protein